MNTIEGSSIEQTGSKSVNKELAAKLANEAANGGKEAEFGPEEQAIASIRADERMRKVYESWAGKTDSKGNDMQKKYVAAFMKSGEVGGYNKQTEDFEKATFSLEGEEAKMSPRMKALDLIKNDARLNKIYNSITEGSVDNEGKDMKQKFVETVMEYGDSIGGYDSEKKEWRKSTFSVSR